MLRILHTADWHLGQSLHGHDRDHEHSLFLNWLLRIIVERSADALLIAGDVFDSVNPSAGAQRRFYDFLARAHAAAPLLQIVVISGNHDAAARLEAPAALFKSLNITAVGMVGRHADGEVDPDKFLVPLRDSSGCVRAIAVAVPFLRPADVPIVRDASDAYLDGIREIYRRASAAARSLRDREYPDAGLVALGHCHIQNALESRDSERRIVIGGAEALRADIFPPELAYVALGHLHKPQEIEDGRIRYCGSPIPLSFSEKDYGHRVLEVLLDNTRLTTVSSLNIPKTASMLRVPESGSASMLELLRLLDALIFDSSLPPEAHPFLEVRVLDDGPDPTRRHCIEQALEGKPVRLALIKLESPQRCSERSEPAAEVPPSLADLGSLDPEDLMLSAYREKYQAEPDDRLLSALREILAAETHAVGAVV